MGGNGIAYLILTIITIAMILMIFVAHRSIKYTLDYLKRAVTYSVGLIFSFVALLFAATSTMGGGVLPGGVLFFQVIPALAMILLTLLGFVVSGSEEPSNKRKISISGKILTYGTIAYVAINTAYLALLLLAFLQTPFVESI